MIYIKNTLTLDTILVSEAFWEEAQQREDLEILEEPRQLRFDDRDNLLDLV